MKKNILIIIGIASIVLITIFVVISCSEKNIFDNKISEMPEIIDELCPECNDSKFWIPSGTTMEEIEYRDEKPFLLITAPEGYLYYGFALDSTLLVYNDKAATPGNSIKVTCTCTNGEADKCKPADVAGDPSCVIQTGCKSCDKEVGQVSFGKSEDKNILTGGFVNPSLGVQFASENENLAYVFAAMFLYPDVQKVWYDFLLEYYSSLDDYPEAIIKDNVATAPEGFSFYIINLYGRALATLLPNDKVAIKAVSNVTHSCPCGSGTGKCKVKGALGVYYCDKDDCNLCNTMVIGDKSYVMYDF